MKVTVHLFGQLSAIAGSAERTLDVRERGTVRDVVHALVTAHVELDRLLLGDAGDLVKSVLLFREDRQVSYDDPTPLVEGQDIVIATAIAGG